MSKRAGIIPPRGSIPRNQLKEASERRFTQRQSSFDDATPWKPRVIDKKPQQKQSLVSRKDKERRVLKQVLTQTKQEFDDLRIMAQREGEQFNIGFAQYLSMLEKRIANMSTEIKKL